MKNIFVLIFILGITCFGSDFMKLSEFLGSGTEAKQDSSIIVVNPIQDKLILYNESIETNITHVFNQLPDYPYEPEIIDTTLMSAESYWTTSNELFMKIKAKTLEGKTDITYTAGFYTEFEYTDSTQTDSTAVDSIEVSDTFSVSVRDSVNYWVSQGNLFTYAPENCLGSGAAEWKAALDFELNDFDYELKAIEFGYAWDGTTDWEIVKFNSTPTDTVIGSLLGSQPFYGGRNTFIEEGFLSKMSGHIAVVFTTTANFMPMDPSGDGDRTWIYFESSGWKHPDVIPDYSGAWYIRLLVYNTKTGIEEVITSEKSPALLQNYPNPFNNETVIAWNLQNSGQVELNIFNSKGQLVKNLVNEAENKGTHSVIFNADGMETGIYFYQLKVNGRIENTAKMLYLK